VLALAACGGGSSSAMPSSGVKGATKTITGGHRVTATETEYEIVLSQKSLAPGTYTFVAMNKGHIAHSLEINGPGVSDKRIAGTIPPGSSKDLTVTLKKGSYQVFCPVAGHRKLGMITQLTVGAHSMSTTGSANTSTTTSGSGSSWG
jgi:uncharacterized cupredoxin-like copper-binding protein